MNKKIVIEIDGRFFQVIRDKNIISKVILVHAFGRKENEIINRFEFCQLFNELFHMGAEIPIFIDDEFSGNIKRSMK